MSGRKGDDQIAMKCRRRARCHDQTVIRETCKGLDFALDLGWVADVDRNHPQDQPTAFPEALKTRPSETIHVIRVEMTCDGGLNNSNDWRDVGVSVSPIPFDWQSD
jgi:hypothetical protein